MLARFIACIILQELCGSALPPTAHSLPAHTYLIRYSGACLASGRGGEAVLEDLWDVPGRETLEGGLSITDLYLESLLKIC